MPANGDRENGSAVVLVAEDEGSLRLALVDALGRNGYGSVEARSGDEVVLVARRERPDLILMDLMMPLLDGYAAARVLRRDPATREIPILAFNAPPFGNGSKKRRHPLRTEDERRLLEKIRSILSHARRGPARAALGS